MKNWVMHLHAHTLQTPPHKPMPTYTHPRTQGYPYPGEEQEKRTAMDTAHMVLPLPISR